MSGFILDVPDGTNSGCLLLRNILQLAVALEATEYGVKTPQMPSDQSCIIHKNKWRQTKYFELNVRNDLSRT